MSGTLGEINVKFGADLSSLTSGIATAKGQMTGFSDTASKAMTDVASAQQKATEAARQLELAQANAALSLKKAQDMASSGKASDEELAVAEAQAALAAERVSAAQLNVVNAEEKAANAAKQLAESEQQEASSADKAASAQQQHASASDNASRSSGGFGSSLVGLVGNVVNFGAKLGQTVFGLQAFGQTMMGVGQALLGPNAAMEQTTVGFETLLGKGKATQAFLQQMKNFAAATPFTFPEVATSAQHMLAFGFAAKDVIPYLTNIGDAMSSMGKGSGSIDHIVQVFGQMHAAGKLNAGDMMQLASEGIPAWKFLADAMHMTIPEVQKLTSQGLMPADKAIQAISKGMHGMFGGGMDAQSKTFTGLMSTLQDNVGAAWRSFTGPLFDKAKGALIDLGNLVTSDKFQKFAKTLGEDVGKGLDQVSKMIGSIDFTTLKQDVQAVTGFFKDFGVGIFDAADKSGAFQSALQFIKDILPDVGNFVSGVGDSLNQNLIPPLKDLITNVGTTASQFLDWMDKSGTAKGALSDLGGVVDGLSKVVGTLVSGVSWLVKDMNEGGIAGNILKDSLFAIGGVIATIKIVQFGKSVVDTFNTTKQSVTDFVTAFGKIQDKASGILDFLKSKFAPGASKAVGDVGSSATTTAGKVEGVGTSAATAEAEVATQTGLMKGEVASVGTSAAVTSGEVKGVGTSAIVAEGEVATSTTLMKAEVTGVGASANTTALGIKGIGAAALGALGALSAIAAVAFGLFETAKWLRDNNIIPMGSQNQPDWVTHNNLQNSGDAYHHYGHAAGGMNLPAGRSVVGEYGPEIIDVPGGANMYNNAMSRNMGMGGDKPANNKPVVVENHVHIYLDSHEMTDIIMSQAARQVFGHGPVRSLA